MESQPVLEHVWETGRILREGVEQAIAAHRLKDTLEVVGLPPMFHLIISESETVSANAVRSFLQQEAVKKGVLFVGYHHTSWAHTMEDIEYTLNVYDDLFYRLKLALQQNNLENQLEGKCISAFNVRQLTKTTQ